MLAPVDARDRRLKCPGFLQTEAPDASQAEGTHVSSGVPVRRSRLAGLAPSALGLLFTVACSSPPQLNDPAKARAALDEARACEAGDEDEQAAKIYLACLASCPEPLAMVGSDLRRISSASNGLEANVWKEVARVEEALGTLGQQERSVRIGALSSVYSAWNAKEHVGRVRRRLRSTLPPRAFHSALIRIAALAPDTIAALSDDEAKAIDQHLAQSRSYDLDMQRSGSVPEELAARLDHSRHRVMAVLASALLNGSRRDLAEAAVDRELSDAKPGVCQSALEASASPDLIRVTELICTRCAAAAGCKKEPSPPQP